MSKNTDKTIKAKRNLRKQISVQKYGRVQARRDLPSRGVHDSKTRGGKALVVAGSGGMAGAGVLCARAAARAGAGYVYVFPQGRVFPSVRYPDFLVLKKATDFSASSFAAAALGPGLSASVFVEGWLWKLQKAPIPVVLDAEGLNVLARLKKPFRVPSNWILTPHEGEMARLLKWSSAKVKAHREEAVCAAQKKWGGVFVLKGSGTLIFDGQTLVQIQSGNAALAKAGTGDVLTGIIVALLSQGVEVRSAAALGAFIHGTVADRWLKSGKDILSLMASDIVEDLPKALAKIRR